MIVETGVTDGAYPPPLYTNIEFGLRNNPGATHEQIIPSYDFIVKSQWFILETCLVDKKATKTKL